MATTYRPFPNLSEWGGSDVDFTSVDSRRVVSEQLAREPPEVLERARQIVTRIAAIETGAIEKLYDNDRGFTITAALQSAVLESLVKKNQQKKHALIECQIRAYDCVLDLVTGRQPLAEAWIRQLHEILCRDQETYTAYSEDGVSRQLPLPRGQYKASENHVLTAGGIHHYTSALDTPAEMQRFVKNVSSPEFSGLHPVDQAAYIHYGLVAIHPFTDGNGRVARALTSIPTYRDFRVPILISVDHRDAYFNALALADEWRFEDFRAFIRDRIVDSVDMLAQSVRTARAGDPQEKSAQLNNLLTTRGGFSQLGIDLAANTLLEKLHGTMDPLLKAIQTRFKSPKLSLTYLNGDRTLTSGTHRRVISRGPRMLQLQCTSSPPANAAASVQIAVAVPKNAAADDHYILDCGPKYPALVLELSVSSVVPNLSLMAEMRVTMFAEEVLSTLSNKVVSAARDSLKKQGFDI